MILSNAINPRLEELQTVHPELQINYGYTDSYGKRKLRSYDMVTEAIEIMRVSATQQVLLLATQTSQTALLLHGHLGHRDSACACYSTGIFHRYHAGSCYSEGIFRRYHAGACYSTGIFHRYHAGACYSTSIFLLAMAIEVMIYPSNVMML